MRTRRRTDSCPGWYPRFAALACLLAMVALELSARSDQEDVVLEGRDSGKGSIHLVVGDPDALNQSERMLVNRLENSGYRVAIVDDNSSAASGFDDIDLIIVSKTVDSLAIGVRFKEAPCGFMTWEDNLQMSHLMGFVDNDGTGGTSWHTRDSTWRVVETAPSALRGGLQGEVEIYRSADEVTYSPRVSEPPSAAIVIAELPRDPSRKTYYAYEKGSMMGDGSPAAGRRVYFGLYDDTAKLLSAEGLALFDMAVAWAATKRRK